MLYRKKSLIFQSSERTRALYCMMLLEATKRKNASKQFPLYPINVTRLHRFTTRILLRFVNMTGRRKREVHVYSKFLRIRRLEERVINYQTTCRHRDNVDYDVLNVSREGHSLKTLHLIFNSIFWQHTNLFIFRFVYFYLLPTQDTIYFCSAHRLSVFTHLIRDRLIIALL